MGPRAASRKRSLKEPTEEPPRFFWQALRPRPLPTTSPKSQPSPYMSTFSPSTPSAASVSALRAARARETVSSMRCPMQSKRKPSTL